jgi:hypothetical protein
MRPPMAAAALCLLVCTATIEAAESNYCAKVEVDISYNGNEIKFESNGSDHTQPITLSECCALCALSASNNAMGSTCQCWSWGRSDAVPGCDRADLLAAAAAAADGSDDELGCCWLKSAINSAGKCDSANVRDDGITSGFFTGTLHEGGLPARRYNVAEILTMLLLGGGAVYCVVGHLYHLRVISISAVILT